MDILNRIRSAQFLNKEKYNKIFEKTAKEISMIDLPEAIIVENDISTVTTKYNSFISNVTNILNKTNKLEYKFLNIFPGTSFNKVTLETPDHSIQYSNIIDYLTIYENQSEFPVYSKPVFTHSQIPYKIITEGDNEHYIDITFQTNINEEQYYVLLFEDGTVIPTKNKNIRINSKLYSKYVLQKFTATENKQTKYISQPFAYYLINTGNKNIFVAKTSNLENRDFHSIRIVDIFVGTLKEKFPISTSIDISTILPKNSQFKISTKSTFSGVTFKYNDEEMDFTLSYVNFGKPILATFNNDSSVINEFILEIV